MKRSGVLHVLGDPNGRPPGLVGAEESELCCCMGAVMNGPRGCTCWEAIYDREQSDELQLGPHPIATKCCHDCAYRKGSPERKGERDNDLQHAAIDPKAVFMCHAGMRKVIGWVHPELGRVAHTGIDSFAPPTAKGRAYMADGRPAILCAGWAATGGRKVPCTQEEESAEAKEIEWPDGSKETVPWPRETSVMGDPLEHLDHKVEDLE